MKSIQKKIIFTFILALLLGAALGRWSVIGFNNPFATPEMKMEHKFKRFSKSLNLNPNQQEKIKNIFQQKHEKIKALKEKNRPEYKVISENTKTEIRSLLTEDQIVKFNDLEEKRKLWREKKNRNPNHPMNHW